MSAETRKWIWLGTVFLIIALGAGASESSGPTTAFHDPPRKGRPWKIEPEVARDLDKENKNIVEVEIVASVEKVQFAPGETLTEAWTYNGTIPGPTIEANVGDTLIVHFYNELPEESTIHWHGLELPANMDGSHIAQNPVPPGGYFRYEFKLLRPSLFWYHPHVRSNEQIEKGLYGALIVHDPDANAALGLPVQEHLLVLDDILLDDDGSIAAPFPNGPDSPDFDPL
jgi:FtsP/CotA-like multicopper oxidase with cupredoxin domain